MSVIQRTFKVSGTGTDVTTATIGWSSADYGIRRNDTGATIAGGTTGQTMTSLGSGAYRYSFTDPANDLTYSYHLKFVYNGRTFNVADTQKGPTSDTDINQTYDDIYNEVSRYLGTGDSPSGTNLTRAQRISNDAWAEMLMGLDPRSGKVYQWSFLYPASTVTATSGSTTSTLPADFEGLKPGGGIYYGNSDSGVRMEERSPGHIDEWYSNGGAASGQPTYYAVEPIGNSAGDHSRYRLKWYPTPGSTTTFYYHYRQEQDALSNNLQGVPTIHRAVKQLARAMAAEQEDDLSPDGDRERQKADKYMAAAIDIDALNKPSTLGYNGDNSDFPYPMVERTGTVTYET